MTHRALHQIADEIRGDWKNIPNYARQHLAPMAYLSTINDYYGCDDGKSIVLYFLSNASTWRGDTARRVKAELKAIVGIR